MFLRLRVFDERDVSPLADYSGMDPEATAVTVQDLLRVLNVACSALQVERDSAVLGSRLKMIEELGSGGSDPDRFGGIFDVATTGLLAFAAKAQVSQRHRDWCIDVCREAGVDIAAVIDESVGLSALGGLGRCHDLPMPVFGPTPDCYQWVPVPGLPFLHNPGDACALNPLFEEFLAIHRTHDRGGVWRRLRGAARPDMADRVTDPHECEQEAGRLVHAELASGRSRPCGLHVDVDWAAVMGAAREIHLAVRPWTRPAVSSACASRLDLGLLGRSALRDLFCDPIRWDGVSTRVNNGQHRLCGIRLAGVGEVLVGYGRW